MDRRNDLTHALQPSSKQKARPGAATSRPVRNVAGTMLVATLAALSLTLLAACGGGGSQHADEGDGEAAVAQAAAAPRASALAVDFRLESEYGPGDRPASQTTARVEARAEIVDRAAVPVDRQAHTRRGLYVSRAVAERIDQETGGRIVWADASCCAGMDAELPALMAFGMQAVLGDEAPVFVSGNDLRQAARLVDRLDALGLGRVYLVTP